MSSKIREQAHGNHKCLKKKIVKTKQDMPFCLKRAHNEISRDGLSCMWSPLDVMFICYRSYN